MKSGSSGTGLGASKRQDAGGNGIVGAGGVACGRQFDCRGREGRRRLREERGEADNRAPRDRERREEKRGQPDGPRPKRRKGKARGGLGQQAEKKGNKVSFLFFEPIFKCFYNLNFEQISFCLNSHITKKMLQHVCIKMFLTLY